MHKLSKALAVVCLAIPLAAAALGTGEIKLYSSLNQRLNAEVPLVVGGDESLDGLRVSLAPSSAFIRIGLERPYFLTGLRFEVLSKDRSAPTIKITSTEAITEPFVRFLVELRWPQGHAVRDFTLLLDPPSDPVSNKPRTVALQRAVSAQTISESPSMHANHASPENFDGTEYGPVGAGDTLWSIAKLVNGDPGVSVEQMAAALYDANPQSFAGGNAAAIIPGTRLRIPDKQAVLSRDKAKARQFIAEHSGVKSFPKTTTKTPPAAAAEPPAKKTATATAPTPASPPQPGKALTLLTPDQASGKPVNAAAKNELALEIAYTVKQENEDILGRLAGLENQLHLMQRLLTLKDAQIAALQAGKPMPALPPELAGVAPPQAAAIPVAQPRPTPSSLPTTGTKKMSESIPTLPSVPNSITNQDANTMLSTATPAAANEPAKPPADTAGAAPASSGQPAVAAAPAATTPSAAPPTPETKPAETAQPPGPPAAVDAAPSGTETAKPTDAVASPPAATESVPPAPVAPAVPPTPVPVPTPQPVPVVVQPPAPSTEAAGWLADPMLLGILGGVGLLIAGLALVAVKRRRVMLAAVENGMPFAPPVEVALAAEPAPGPTSSPTEGSPAEPVQPGSFLGDLPTEDFTAADDTAVQPDVAGSAQSSALIDVDDLDFSFDLELDEPPAPAASVTPEQTEASAEPITSSGLLDFEADTVEPFSPSATTAEPPEPLVDVTPSTADMAPVESAPSAVGVADADAHHMAFDLGDFDSGAAQPAAEPPAPKQAPVDDGMALEFDVAGLNDGGFRFAGVVQSADQPEAPLVEEQGRLMEFDMAAMASQPEPPPPPPAVTAKPAPVAEENFEFDLSDFAVTAEASPPPSETKAKPQDEFDFDMSFDLSRQPQDDAAAADDEQALIAPSDEIDSEQIESKLDLARAFIDMENPAVAKQMLEEVLQLGDARQKKEAQDLLNTLG